MKKRNKKIVLYLGAFTAISTTVVSVVACGDYNPTGNDLANRNFLSGKHAYNKALADYYLDSVTAMYADSKNTMKVNLKSLQFDTYQWIIHANAIKNPYYWGKQRNDWIKNGTFIDKSKGSKVTDIKGNEVFVKTLFKQDAVDNYVLKNDEATFNALQDSKGNDKGSGVIMDVNRQLYSMAYLLLTNKNDVQNWLIGNPNDPTKKGKGTIKDDEKNEGQYFFIDYLRQSKPFIMWKNEQKIPSDPSASFTGTDAANSTKFNALSNTSNLIDNMAGTLALVGGKVKAGSLPTAAELQAFESYAGLQTSNPFTKNGSNPRHGDIDPQDAYMKATPGGYQGWVNNSGEILQNLGDAVNINATTRDYAYIQQLLPTFDSTTTAYPKGAFRIPDWMTTEQTNNTGTSLKNVAAVWNIAFQISFYSSNILTSAKDYWVHNGYSLKVFVPDLEANLSGAHIYK